VDQWEEGSFELEFWRFSELDVSAGLEIGVAAVSFISVCFAFLDFLVIVES